MTELEASGVGEPPPPYMIFVVVFLFFVTGLLGFLICHLLKKKGYRCRTGDMDDEEEEEKLGGNADDEDEENQDTVEQILKCIIENEANMEAFNEMFGKGNVCVRHDPRLRKESIGGVPPHHHTVHSGTDHNTCHLCAQVRSKKGRRQSRTPRFKQRPGEQTVFSVGRFRVTHTDKKTQGGPNPLAISGDQLDQSQDSEERKEAGYNLRSMFKDVRPPSEGANGIAANVGKRRKSVTIFGLRRGSDPVGIKGGEGIARETGGVKFAIQQQPVVLEEPLHAQVNPERGTKPGSKPETKSPKTPGSSNSPSSQSTKQVPDSSSGPEEGTKLGPSPEPQTKTVIKPSTEHTTASAPSSLPVLSEKRVDVEGKVLKTEEAYDPGPLQTSTPITPMPGSIPGLTPVVPAGQPGPYASSAFPVTQTPPDPSFSSDLEPGVNPALISLGSSPPSSISIKTLSSVSSLKTPTSPLAMTPSPNLSSRHTPSEAAKPALSPALTLSPKLPPGRSPGSLSSLGQSPVLTPKLVSMPVSPQSPSSSPADQNLSSPRLTLKSGSVTSVTSMTKGDTASMSLSLKEPGGTTTPEKKRAGILKTSKLSPGAAVDSKGSAVSSPSGQLFTDRMDSLPLSLSTPLSPSSPQGSRVSSVTVVKASPDSKREFSVVTMVEEDQSTSIKDQKAVTSEFGVELEEGGISVAVGQGGEVSVTAAGRPENQSGETSGAEARPMLTQDKDDMVEMEDIRDCKVMQVEEGEEVESRRD